MDAKQKNLTVISALIAIILAVSFLIIKPTIIYIKNVQKQIETQREELEKKYQQMVYLKKNYQKFQEIKKQLAVLDGLFLIKGQELEFITTLEDVAAKNNIFQEINLKKVDLDNPIQANLAFSLSATGETHDIVNYLLEIEQLSYYINFDSLNINSQTSGKKQIAGLLTSGAMESANSINIKLSGKIYLLEI